MTNRDWLHWSILAGAPGRVPAVRRKRSPLWRLTPEEAEDIIAIAYEVQAGKRGGPNDGAPQEAA